MLYSWAISYGLLFALAVKGQSQSNPDSTTNGQSTPSDSSTTSKLASSTTSSEDNLVLSGTVRQSTPPIGTNTPDGQATFTGTRNATTTSANATASTQTSSSTAIGPTNITPCNGYTEFCDRKYGNITEVAAHNSPFIKQGNAAANQALPVSTQLDDGVRLLQGQVHFVDNTPHFCHTSCQVLDAGPITDYLGAVYRWVSAHPYDVVTIMLGNSQFLPVEQYVPFLESTGLVKYAYTPPKIPMNVTDWPTLGSLILSGKRVIFFMDYEANQGSVPWILDEFSQMWETPFDPTDRSFPCTVQRPPNLPDADAKSRLYLVNHNLNYDISLLGNSILVPNIPLLNVTNNITGIGSLGESAQACTEQWSRPPKFLNVDYYNAGDGTVFEVAATCNNVTYDKSRQCCGKAASHALRALEPRGLLATIVAGMLAVLYLW